MPIVIKEIHVKTTVEKSGGGRNCTVLTPEYLRSLKREIVQDVIKDYRKQIKWEKER